jgi:3-oxoacyl-[acyl-carrier protein] reductase
MPASPPEVDFRFAHRTVIVTGAARGIGLATVERFATAGARVYAVDVDAGAGAPAAQRSGARWCTADVSDTAAVDAVVATAIEETGRVDVLVNNAGILRDNVLWKIRDEDWDAVLGVHLGGTYRFTRACTPHFRARGYGRVVNVTSYTGLHGNVGQAAYAAAKAGIIGYTRTAAKELGRFGVTVNAVSPNADTRMIAGISPEKRAEFESMTPLGRYAEPAEITAAIAFLASAEADYITGAVLPVDGGLSI